jgi:hypothetical protein
MAREELNRKERKALRKGRRGKPGPSLTLMPLRHVLGSIRAPDGVLQQGHNLLFDLVP